MPYKDPDKRRQSAKRAQQLYRARNPKKAAQSSKESQLKCLYGITQKDYDQILKSQNECCAICGKHYSLDTYKNLCVDHDHNTLKVRGLLCLKCNSALGKFQDSVFLLEKAVAYLKEKG